MIRLYHSHRLDARDKRFAEILETLRTMKADNALVQEISRNRAWGKGPPTVNHIKELLREVPHTTIVTYSRLGSQLINERSVEAKYGRKTPLVVLPGDIDCNPDNFENGQLRKNRLPKPSEVKIYKGMQLYLTQNLVKTNDFVNGMLATVENYRHYARVLFVRTRTNHRLALGLWTDKEHGGVKYYPIRYGYSSTLHKIQGATLKHMTLYPDVENMHAAGYTALSRVAKQDDYLIGGNVVPKHFVPAL